MIGFALLALLQAGPVAVDEKAGKVSFGAVVVKLDQQPQLKGVVEYLLVNKGGKDYESLFRADVDAGALYEGLKRIGAKPGAPPADEKSPPTGSRLRITAAWMRGDESRVDAIESFVLDTKTGKPMERVPWVFTGSKEGFVPPLERTDLLVKAQKNLVSLVQSDPTVLVMNPVLDGAGHRYQANRELIPKEGTPVTIVIEAVK